MRRVDAYQMLIVNLKSPLLIKHSLAVECAMIAICRYLNKNATQEEVDKWAVTGMLHDADYELTGKTPDFHGIVVSEKIALPEDIAHAIRAHNWQNTGYKPETPMEWAVATCDQLAGLIVAATLIHPSKKLSQVTPEFVLKRFYEKSFAKGCDRKAIQDCETNLNIPLLTYIIVVLNAMKTIAPTLGL